MTESSNTPHNTSRRVRSILVIVVALLAVLGITVALVGNPTRLSTVTVTDLERFTRSFGQIAPLVVILLVLLRTALPFLPIPTPLLLITNGIVFGFWLGAFLSWIAHMVAAVYAFYFSRLLGEDAVGRTLRGRSLYRYWRALAEKGPWLVFLLRLVMASPFNVVSYVSGLTEMRAGWYLLATAVGIIPEVIISAYIGASLQTNWATGDRLKVGIALGLLGLGLAYLVSRVWERYLHHLIGEHQED